MKVKQVNLGTAKNIKDFEKATDLEANLMAYFGYVDPKTKEFWVGDTPIGSTKDVVADVREIINNDVKAFRKRGEESK